MNFSLVRVAFFFEAILPLKITCATNSDVLMHSASGAHFKKLLLYKHSSRGPLGHSDDIECFACHF